MTLVLQVPIWDTGVYTRHRNFRLPLSAKAARPTVALHLAPESSFYQRPPSGSQLLQDGLLQPDPK